MKNFLEFLNESVVEGYSDQEILDIVNDHIQNKIEEFNLDISDFKIALTGSRVRNDNKVDSDIDILMEYVGFEREDDVFNILNDNDDCLYIDDLKVDINPLNQDEDSSHTIKNYLEMNKKFKK